MSNDYSGNLGLKQEVVFGEEVSPLEVYEEIVNESIMMETEQIRARTANGLRVSRYTVPGRITAGGGINTYKYSSPRGSFLSTCFAGWRLRITTRKLTNCQ